MRNVIQIITSVLLILNSIALLYVTQRENREVKAAYEPATVMHVTYTSAITTEVNAKC